MPPENLSGASTQLRATRNDRRRPCSRGWHGFCATSSGRAHARSRWCAQRSITCCAFTLPPAILSKMPVVTYTQSSLPLSLSAWLAHECLRVPQSLLPALAIPAHFSMPGLVVQIAAAAEPCQLAEAILADQTVHTRIVIAQGGHVVSAVPGRCARPADGRRPTCSAWATSPCCVGRHNAHAMHPPARRIQHISIGKSAKRCFYDVRNPAVNRS